MLCFLHWCPWAHFRFPNDYKFLMRGRKHSLDILYLNWIIRNNLDIKLSGFADNLIFLTPVPVVSVLEGQIKPMISLVNMFVFMCANVWRHFLFLSPNIWAWTRENLAFWGLWTTPAQISLCISTVWSAPLLFTFWKVLHVNLLQWNSNTL